MKGSKQNSEEQGFRVFVKESGEDEVTFGIAGRVSLANFDAVYEDLGRLLREESRSSVRVDLSEVDYLDSAGARALFLLEEDALNAGKGLSLSEVPDGVRRIINLARTVEKVPEPPKPKPPSSMVRLGEQSLDFLSDIKGALTFLGELTICVARVCRRPGMVRWGDVILYMGRVGVDALPIIGLMSFLIGLIIAFMSSLQLKLFGANLFVASLVGISMVRELGPIMTAVMVAGRSGSAFAAEIGTMKVSEEVDALRVMGFDPTVFLAVPKVFASLVVVPILTLFADIFGILGGLVVGVVGLDLTVPAYLDQTLTTMTLFDVNAGLCKAAVFALVIAAVGCQRGFETEGGAQAVGRSTTSAVVTSIFLIVVVDSAFAILLHYIQ